MNEVPGGPPDPGPVSSEFPCDVAALLQTCQGCHSSPPRGGAPFPLMTRADLAGNAVAFPGSTLADRALVRVKQTSNPMPPAGLPRPTDPQIAAFEAWIQAGMPAGMCAGNPGGDGPDAGVPEPDIVCSSGMYWPTGSDSDDDDDDDGSPDMNPGRACRACHLDEEEERAYFFMGTAYPTLHEEDRCVSIVPSGTRVEIIDANGQVAITMNVRDSGNFFNPSRTANVALPFTARVVTATGAVSQMNTPQMTGDCNGCHTELGNNGAPGRVLIPQ